MGCGASKITGDKKAFLDARRAKHHKDEAPDPDAAAKGCKFLRSGVSLKRIIEKNSVLVVVRAGGRARCIIAGWWWEGDLCDCQTTTRVVLWKWEGAKYWYFV